MNMKKIGVMLCGLLMVCASLSIRAEYTLIREDVVGERRLGVLLIELEHNSCDKESNALYKIVICESDKKPQEFYLSNEGYNDLADYSDTSDDFIIPDKKKGTVKVYQLNTQANQVYALHNNMNHNLHENNHTPELLMRQNQGNNESSQKMYAYGASCIVGCAGIYALYKYMSRHK